MFTASIAYLSERIARLNEQVWIYSNPAQVQIYDRKDKPYTRAIRCTILPCGKYTGRPRKCVVECKVERSDSLPEKPVTREDSYVYGYIGGE